MDDKEKPEHKGKSLDPSSYEVGRFQKNAMIILSDRPLPDVKYGARDDDTRILTNTFVGLNFEVTFCRRSDHPQALSTLEGFFSNDFGAYGCVCIAILAHDASVLIPEIHRYLNIKRNPSLAGKPLVIIIQGCTGYKRSHVEDNPVEPGYSDVPWQPDMIVFHSLSHGISSYRDEQGSDAIKTLCQEIRLHCSKDDLNTIFNRATEVLLKRNVGSRGAWPDVSIRSTLTKKLYFRHVKVPISEDEYWNHILSRLSNMESEEGRKSSDKSKRTLDKDISLDSKVFHPASNLMPTADYKSSSTKDPPKDSNEEAPTSNQTTTGGITTITANTSTNIESTNTSNLPSTEESNRNHPKHILKKYAPTYELEEYSRNAMLIFNHEKFLSDDPRIGTMKDEEALTETFKKYGFVVQSYMDLKRRALLDTVKKFAEQTDFSTYGCICIAVLTHGGNGPGYLQAYDTSYSEHEVLERFNARKNSTLAGKAIIFLIQACRGRDPAPAVQAGKTSPSDLEYDRGEDCEHYTIPTESDMLIFHSSYIGRASVRSRTNGTWFIQTLCSMIKKHAATCDLETIFRKVKMAVALDAAEWVEDALKVPKQMPVVTTTVIREIYLRPYDPQFLDPQSKDEVDKAIDSGFESMQISDASSLNEDPPSTDMSMSTPVQFMPCSCFLEYFVYLKKCLGLYICENSEDPIAIMLMEMTEKEGDGVEHIYVKLRLMETIWEHLKKHTDKFPYDYVYRSHY